MEYSLILSAFALAFSLFANVFLLGQLQTAPMMEDRSMPGVLLAK
jgi:hypothetical protein